MDLLHARPLWFKYKYNDVNEWIDWIGYVWIFFFRAVA